MGDSWRELWGNNGYFSGITAFFYTNGNDQREPGNGGKIQGRTASKFHDKVYEAYDGSRWARAGVGLRGSDGSYRNWK